MLMNANFKGLKVVTVWKDIVRQPDTHFECSVEERVFEWIGMYGSNLDTICLSKPKLFDAFFVTEKICLLQEISVVNAISRIERPMTSPNDA